MDSASLEAISGCSKGRVELERSDPSWNVLLTTIAIPKTFATYWKYGGGALMDIGCYGVYIARLVFDEEPTRVLGLIEEDPEMRTDAVTLSGDYAEALAAADRAKELLWGAFGEIMLLDYFYYTALGHHHMGDDRLRLSDAGAGACAGLVATT